MKYFWILLAVVLAAATSGAIAGKGRASCFEVRRVFASKGIGPMKLVPFKPVRSTKLEICPAAVRTCCNRKMEKKYQSAARDDLAEILSEKASFLKEQFTTFLKEFKDDFKDFLNQTKKETLSKFNSTISNFSEINSLIDSIFDDSIMLFNEDNGVVQNKLEEKMKKLFTGVLVSTFKMQSETQPADEQLQCIAHVMEKMPQFNPENELVEKLSTFFNLTAAIFQAVHSGVEILNSPTDSFINTECERSLMKMQFCSHCYGFTLIKPCSNYCRNVMNGCLVGITEINRFWKYYVTGLNDVIERMSANEADPESVMTATLRHIEVLANTKFDKEIISQIMQACFQDSPRLKRSADDFDDDVKPKSRHQRRRHHRRNGKSDLELSSEPGLEQENPLTPKRIIPPPHEMLRWEPTVMATKGRKKDNGRDEGDGTKIMGGLEPERKKLNLKSKLRRFIAHLGHSSNYFSTISEDLCTSRYGSSYTVSLKGSCWNGENITVNYTTPVVKKRWKHQRGNPEVKVTGVGQKAYEIILKLQVISKSLMIEAGKNQIPKELLVSPDYVISSVQSQAPCADDEDACAASGSGLEIPDEGQRQNKDSTRRKDRQKKKTHSGRKRTSNGKKKQSTNPNINIMADVNGQISEYLLPDQQDSSPTSLDGARGQHSDSTKNKGPGGSASRLTISVLSWRTLLILLIVHKLIT